MTEWIIKSLEGQPRLLWFYGSHLLDLNPTSLTAASDQVMPLRPELDVLLAMLRFAIEQAEKSGKGLL